MKKSTIILLALGAVLLVGPFILSGCVSDPADVGRLEQLHDQTTTAIDQAKTDLRTLNAQIATLDPNDPVRKSLEPAIAELSKRIAQLEKYEPLIKASLDAAKTGTLDPEVVRTATSLAGIPYAGTVSTLIAIVAGWLGKRTADKKFTELASGVHDAMPDLNEMTKLALYKPLSPRTQAALEAAKTGG